jgi:hypothetical protein
MFSQWLFGGSTDGYQAGGPSSPSSKQIVDMFGEMISNWYMSTFFLK